jgi:hypothetical protein
VLETFKPKKLRLSSRRELPLEQSERKHDKSVIKIKQTACVSSIPKFPANVRLQFGTTKKFWNGSIPAVSVEGTRLLLRNASRALDNGFSKQIVFKTG